MTPPDAYATAAAIRTGAVSAVETVAAALERCDRLDAAVNAFTVTFGAQALESAHRVDVAHSDGEHLGPLAGVPVSIKDHIWLAGAPATNGSLAYADFVPDESCAGVSRLLDAGAIVVGKTNNPEFCYRGITDNDVYGLTRNPRDLSRTPGGSSGGAGASVAAGIVPLAVGTDGGGSIRIPSAFCGVYGLKPTFGLIPKLPGFRGWPTLSVNGPIADSVRDLALALTVMAGPAASDPLSYPAPPTDYLAAALDESDLRGLRVAVSFDLGFAAIDPGVRSVFAGAVARFAALGCELTEVHPVLADPGPLWDTIALAEGYSSEGPLLAQWADRMTTGTAELVRAGADITAGQYVDAQHERALFSRGWAEFFEQYDLILTPAMPVTAFETGLLSPRSIDGQPLPESFDGWCALALPANLTGCPAASVPIGAGADGLPVGLQIMGPRWREDLVLRAAAAWERLSR
jgi:Asp-tRNA(Asn)/Glu-tRNA(Gln) amidotransferase A subunit family amidase